MSGGPGSNEAGGRCAARRFQLQPSGLPRADWPCTESTDKPPFLKLYLSGTCPGNRKSKQVGHHLQMSLKSSCQLNRTQVDLIWSVENRSIAWEIEYHLKNLLQVCILQKLFLSISIPHPSFLFLPMFLLGLDTTQPDVLFCFPRSSWMDGSLSQLFRKRILLRAEACIVIRWFSFSRANLL